VAANRGLERLQQLKGVLDKRTHLEKREKSRQVHVVHELQAAGKLILKND